MTDTVSWDFGGERVLMQLIQMPSLQFCFHVHTLNEEPVKQK